MSQLIFEQLKLPPLYFMLQWAVFFIGYLSAINDTTVQVVLPADSKLTNTDLVGKTIKLTAAPMYEVALHCFHLKKTKIVYLLNATTYVWTDLVGFETTYWNGEIGYQELTREGVEKWCWKLSAMLHNETILMWQLGEYTHQYHFNYREVLEDLLERLEEILKSDEFKNSRYFIEFVSEKAERQSITDWWEYDY